MSSESNATSNSEVSSGNSSIVKQLGGKKPKGHKKACKCVICKRGGADTVSMDDKTLSASDDMEEDQSVTMDNKKDDEPVEGVEGVEDAPSASDNNKDVSPSKGGKRRRRRTAKKGKSRRNKSRRSTKRRRSSRRR
jgi:hypothetical protein